MTSIANGVATESGNLATTSSDSRDATADTLPGCASTTKTSSFPSITSIAGGAPPGARWYGQWALVRTQMPQCCGGRRVSGASRERRTPGPDGVAREEAEGARQRDLFVARTRDVIHDATALALMLDTGRRALTAEGATT